MESENIKMKCCDTFTVFHESILFTVSCKDVRELITGQMDRYGAACYRMKQGTRFDSRKILILLTIENTWNEGVSKSFRTESIRKYKLTTTSTLWEATQRVMAAKLTRMTYKIAIQLHLVAESCTICCSRSRRPVRKLLDTPSYTENLKFKIISWRLKNNNKIESHLKTVWDGTCIERKRAFIGKFFRPKKTWNWIYAVFIDTVMYVCMSHEFLFLTCDFCH
jgi:hypothetical protein